MSLVVDGQLATLAEDLIDDISYIGSGSVMSGKYAMTQAAHDRSKDVMKAYLSRVLGYVSGGGPGSYNSNKGWLEVNGVKAALDTGVRAIEAYTVGVGNNGGALASATGGPVSGSVNDSKLSSSTQNNNGTGLVS